VTDLCKNLYDRVLKLENGKLELELTIRQKDHEIGEMENIMRTESKSFLKPTLKRVRLREKRYFPFTEVNPEIDKMFCYEIPMPTGEQSQRSL
jgi:hypothetical protein